MIKKEYYILILVLVSIVPLLLLPLLSHTGYVIYSAGELNFSLENNSDHFVVGDVGGKTIEYNVSYSNTVNCSIHLVENLNGEKGNSYCRDLRNRSEGDKMIYNSTCYFSWPGEFVYNVSCVADGIYDSATSSVIVDEAEVEFTLNKSFVGVSESSLAWGDINSDGYWDLVYGGKNTTPDQSFYFCSNNRSNVSCELSEDIGFSSGAISYGDVDLDGDLDVLVNGDKGGNPKTYYLSILENNDGFNQRVNLTGISGSSVLFDYNDDGLLDIIASDSTEFYFYKNNGNFNFTLDNTYNAQSGSWCKGMVNPFRQGGDNFLLTCGEVVNLSDGDGSVFYDFNDYSDAEIVVFDSNNDNDIDFLICGHEANCVRYEFENLDLFNLHEEFSFIKSPSITFGDINNDGKKDFLLTNFTKSYYFLSNSLDEYDEFEMTPTLMLALGSTAFFDYDNDGDLDLSVVGLSSAKIYNNNFNTKRNNTPPEPPSIFNSYYENSKLHMFWDKGSDDISGVTTQDGLYYNLEVIDVNNNTVVSGKYGGSSNPTQGYLGNMFQQLNYSLNVDSKYLKWRVQTIDAELKSSEWSDWQIYNPCNEIPDDKPWIIDSECLYNGDSVSVDVYIGSSGTLVIDNQDFEINNININGSLILRNSNLTNHSHINFIDDGNIIKQWYVNFNILDDDNNTLTATTNQIMDKNNNSLLWQNYYNEYVWNETGKEYFSNYTITISKDRYEDKIYSFNLTNNIDEDLIVLNFIYPIVSEFNESITTNFSNKSIDDLENLSNVIIGNDYGKIKFLDSVNVKSLDIDDIVEISEERIVVDESILSNETAELEFSGLSYDSVPNVLRNGEACNQSNYCLAKNYDKDNKILKVNVTGFSEYTLQGNADANVIITTGFFNKTISDTEINFDINYYNTSSNERIIGNNCNLSLGNGSSFVGITQQSVVYDNIDVHNYTISCKKEGYDKISKTYYLQILPNSTYFSEVWSGEGVGKGSSLVALNNDLIWQGFDDVSKNVFVYDTNLNKYVAISDNGLNAGSLLVLDMNKTSNEDIISIGIVKSSQDSGKRILKENR